MIMFMVAHDVNYMRKLERTTLEEIGNTITTGAFHEIVWVRSTNVPSHADISAKNQYISVVSIL
jgi:hypothetical protein